MVNDVVEESRDKQGAQFRPCGEIFFTLTTGIKRFLHKVEIGEREPAYSSK